MATAGVAKWFDMGASTAALFAAAYCAFAVFRVSHTKGLAEAPPRPTVDAPALVREVQGTEPTTVIAVLRRGCPACDAEAPFLRRLDDLAARRRGRLKVVFVFPERQGNASTFMITHGLSSAAVRLLRFPEFHITSTPLLVASGPDTKGIETWSGAIDGKRADTIVDHLAAATIGASLGDARQSYEARP
jgi:hypothetical protein